MEPQAVAGIGDPGWWTHSISSGIIDPGCN